MSRAWSSTWCCVACFFPTVAQGAASGSDSRVDWSWRAEPGLIDCASEGEIRERVEAQLAASGGQERGDAQATVRVELASTHDGHRARIVVEFQGGVGEERELLSEGESCRQLDEALVLSLTLLLSPIGELRASTGQRAADAAPARSQVDREANGPEPEPPLPLRNVGARLGIGPVLSVGQLPGLGLGGMLGMSVPVGGPWAVGAGASYLGTRHIEEDSVRFAFSATEAWLGVVHGLRWTEAWQFDLEAALLVGWLHAVPKSPSPSEPGDSGFGGGRLAASLGGPVTSKLGLSLTIAGHVLANTWRFYVRDVEDPIWAQPRVGGRLEMLMIWGDH